MGQIYTLAQIGTKKTSKPEITIHGKGSDLSNADLIKTRAKRKLITQSLALKLVTVAEGKNKHSILKSYWNAYHCQNRITSANGKLFTTYCKNRCCTVCSGNRQAGLINKYLPIVKSWDSPNLVTLTFKACMAKDLKRWIDALFRGITKMEGRLKKRHQRRTGIKVMGIRALECNFNPIARTYNPHFHILVPNKQTAELLISEWLKMCTLKFANPKAQHKRAVINTERDLIETIKYGCKIMNEPNEKFSERQRLNRKKFNGNDGKIYVSALDTMFKAMQKHRLFERFGFNIPNATTKPKQAAQILQEYDIWEYDIKRSDWGNTQNDEVLSDYVPPPNLLHLLGFDMDLEKE